jgi:hypothetical protein
MWMVTKGEAIEMYARFFLARHRSAASRLARETAHSHQKKGDLDGHEAWNAVADAIDRRGQNIHGPMGQETVTAMSQYHL